MSDPAVWSVAFLLVSAGVAAEGYLAWSFTRAWREGRAEARARRARWKTGGRGTDAPSDSRPGSESDTPTNATQRGALLVCAGFATAGMTSVAAAAQSTPPQSEPVTSGGRLVEGTQPGQASATASAESTSTPNATTSVASVISVQLNIDFTNAYFYRGIRQQDRGLIVQPAARVTTRLVDDAELKLDGFFGTWNSFGPNAGAETRGLLNDWYEADMYAGLSVTLGKLSLATSYTFLTSPSDAFQAVQELGFTLALDDSEWLKAFALKPSASLAIETGANGSDGPDLNNGVYLELGIAPGFSFDVNTTPITMTFPASVGLSLLDYYQDADGSDDAFGFAQVGVKASVPLGEPGRFGAATLSAGVSVLMLGDHTKAFNKGDGTEVIGTVGVQWNY